MFSCSSRLKPSFCASGKGSTACCFARYGHLGFIRRILLRLILLRTDFARTGFIRRILLRLVLLGLVLSDGFCSDWFCSDWFYQTDFARTGFVGLILFRRILLGRVLSEESAFCWSCFWLSEFCCLSLAFYPLAAFCGVFNDFFIAYGLRKVFAALKAWS